MDTNKPNYFLVPVESSQISHIGWNSATKVLAIRFRAKKGPGSLYTYAEVPQETWMALRTAKSVGTAFGALIKGKFAFVKIVEQPPEETK